ncbi:LamG-like jellyroll fold domain-containing protein [Prosthecobacter sp.]|uniref:LamG-like jellyroll fold domain-containing protein n=1 Tax=Prosthecobacter sp. TaxID=1965333 RepID=UPI001D3F8D29|nr:LamG-like jellyroll fold domain-containing protein [Prosthecobacter sp.]MCB1278206.1 FecR domain-containing protein [Prosthecobacter sp.]
MNHQERNQLIDSLIEGDISEADFVRLEAEFSVDKEARQAYYDRLTLSAMLTTAANAPSPTMRKPVQLSSRRWIPAFAAMAATIVALLAVTGVLLKSRRDNSVASVPTEQKASGFAVLAGQADAVWANQTSLADGALLPAGSLSLASGVAQIELFSGVTVIVEGTAEFEIVSPMEMSVTRGKVRARVPEPAHGFRIHTAEGEVVDLGTEFALNISDKQSEVHVLDGEVEWHPRSKAMRRMEKGEALRWGTDGKGADLTADSAKFIGIAEMNEKLAATRKARHENWQRFSDNLRRDPRLVAYYQMGSTETRRLPNEATNDASMVSEAAIVAAARVEDRWGRSGAALDFSPTGSRVRVNVPGEHASLTMFTWVKINSLDRLFNSLFLTDGHDLGEPHWQITNDGRLFFSVKKFETQDKAGRRPDKHNFYSPPFWNAALSGQWMMLAVVYDVETKRVNHYLNGKAIHSEAIPDEYLVETVHIGAASIGNWSEPAYRKGPEFAVRNLNGSMDEFALFDAALTTKEIADIYEHGRP